MSKALDVVAMARQSPFWKRNTNGKGICTLCNVVCSDEPHFMAHLEGKRHRSTIEAEARRDAKRRRQVEEEEEFEAAKARAEAQRSADRLMKSGGRTAFAPHGKPSHSFRTEASADQQQCKVWLEFYFSVVADDTRPLHRWRNSREVADVVEDDVVYLLVACEGYETVGMKFPKVARTTEADADEGLYKVSWDPIKKIYSLFFVLG